MTPRHRSTIDDVAKAAGVSAATVSRALRDLPNVAPATRRRIARIASDLEYAPHPQASRLASGKTMTVGLVAPLFGLWYASQVVAGAETVLSGHGYDLLVHAVDTADNRSRLLRHAASLRGRIDGLILVDFFATPEHADRLRQVGRPVVTIGEKIPSFSSVTIDNERGAAMAARHLIELGHQCIGLITGPLAHGHPSPVPGARAAGFAAALAAAGVVHDPHLTRDGGFTVAGGAAAVEQLLAMAVRPTAVFCLSDEMAFGAIGRAQQLGYRVPDDISIVGFDDHDVAESFGLSTVHQPVRAMGSAATEILLQAIATPGAPPVHRAVEVALMRRRSTGPPAPSPA
ncbi:MAG TPA: LacI family DNA-binding transcriptional regulator [Acidimicrobiia bacterium]|nr:LacI family DNA-binding transcriptional regulator [Acidimicrobiia bacterium]